MSYRCFWWVLVFSVSEALLSSASAAVRQGKSDKESHAPPLTWRSGARDYLTTERVATELVADPATGEVTTKEHRYIEIASGLNYFDSSSGAFVESQDLIELMPDGGAAALRCPTKVYFDSTLKAPIRIVTRNGTVMHTRILGLYYYDSSSDRAVPISGVSNVAGELYPPNQVIYKDAFNCGDMRITCTKAGYETDFVLTSRPKPPEYYGLKSATTALELWHEWLGAPEPRRISKKLPHDATDETINFEDLWFPIGKAFNISRESARDSETAATIKLPDSSRDEDRHLISKHWVKIGQRHVLIESLPWSVVRAETSDLEEASTGHSSPAHFFAGRVLPPQDSGSPEPNARIKIAKRPYRSSGFAMDYITVTASGDYTFSSSTTYYVPSTLYIGGIITFNSSCYIKMNTNALSVLYGEIICNGSSDYPSIITSMYDNSSGETIAVSTNGLPLAGSPALGLYYISTNVTLSGLEIRWANKAIQLDASGCGDVTHTVIDSWLRFSPIGIYANGCNVIVTNSYKCGLDQGLVMAGIVDDSCNVFTGDLTSVCGADGDLDGIADSWEYQFFGKLGIDKIGDLDGDGVNNLNEYRMGRNPSVAGTTSDSGNLIQLKVFTPLK